MRLDNSIDEDSVVVRGYRIKFNFTTVLRLSLFFGTFLCTCFLWSNASNSTSKLILGIVAVLIVFLAIIFHAPTKISFSRDVIKISHGLLPIVRKRKTKDLVKVSLEFSESLSNDAGSTFNYIVLNFDKSWNIKIMADQLTRKEKEEITTKLSYLRYKFSKESNYEV